MSLQTEEPNVEPPNDVDNEMAIINWKMEKQLVMIKSNPNWLKREGKNSRRPFVNSFKKYGRKRSYQRSGNMA
jgi:hypothetical protein